ncbi:MAG: putative lipid II flippase FtsW [Christensenellaceae bacterium]|jgi:cell division protein FtsW|nr:putative lipid II flippase FtsW [Christensenellaceae bacterium]
MVLRRNIFLTAIALSLFGIVMIYSASSYSANLQYGDEFYFVKKQILAFIVGVTMLLICSKFNLVILNKLKWPLYIFGIGLLVIVLIPGIGSSVYGATRRIDVGFFSFQPSEIAKFSLIILSAGIISIHPPLTVLNIFITMIPSIIMCVLVMLEPNMSITVCIALTMAIMTIAGGLSYRATFIIGLTGLLSIPLLIIAEPYRLKRLMAFLNPWDSPQGDGYQLIQSYFAIGSGGILGVGLFQSNSKYLYLPFAESDFIFSIIAEELGLIGCVITVLVYIIYITTGFIIAIKTHDKFKSLLALGITSLVGIQTLVNIAVVTGSIPPTGLPLPFISAGGSSLIVFLAATGILMNIESSNRRTCFEC